MSRYVNEIDGTNTQRIIKSSRAKIDESLIDPVEHLVSILTEFRAGDFESVSC